MTSSCRIKWMPGRGLNPIRFKNGDCRFQFRYHFVHDKEGPYLRDLGVLEAPGFAHSAIFSSCLTPERAANSANISWMMASSFASSSFFIANFERSILLMTCMLLSFGRGTALRSDFRASWWYWTNIFIILNCFSGLQ